MRDYTRISYYMAPNGTIWHGPFSPEDTMHYKPVDSNAVCASEPPQDSMVITARQAAEYMAELRRDCEVRAKQELSDDVSFKRRI